MNFSAKEELTYNTVRLHEGDLKLGSLKFQMLLSRIQSHNSC